MRWITSLVVAIMLCAVSAQAKAESAVLLGLRSVEGDDDFANDLTQALRRTLSGMSGVQLSDRAVSLSQMSMAYGCEEPDAACLTDIASGLQTQNVIYGTIRRTSTRDDYQYSLSISFFSMERASIENTVTRSIPQQDRDLDQHATAVLTALMGQADTAGSIVVHTDVPTAEVTVNGQPVGSTVEGSLRLSGLAAGRYQVVVRALGMRAYSTTVSVRETESTAVEATMEPVAPVSGPEDATAPELEPESSGNGSWKRIVGFSFLGLAAVGVVGTIYSWAEISSINGDADFEAYRRRVAVEAPNVSDVCATNNPYAAAGSPEYAAYSNKVRPACSDADLFETLQWVFLTTAVVAGGAGTYFLLTAGGDEDDTRASTTPSVSFRPRLARETQSLEATFRF